MDKRINIAIVGLNFGRHIIKELSEGCNPARFRLAAICDINQEKVETEAARLGVRAYYTLDELLKDESIQAVGLYTGPVNRSALLRQIIRAGKDVMTTKPFELDADAAREVLEEAERLGRVIHLNSPSPLPSADLQVVAEWREKHTLGRPVGCRIECWANYKEEADGTWYDDPQLCPAPPLYRLGIYLMNDLIWLLGTPEKVSLLQSRIRTGRPTADNAQMGVLFAGGAIANVFASFCVRDGQLYRNAYVMNYENGTIYRNIGPEADKSMETVKLIAHGGDVLETAHTQEHSGAYQWGNFYRAVNGENIFGDNAAEKRKAYIDRIVNGVKVMDAMKRAQEGGSAYV